jgi:hypothetical protein
VAHLNLVKYVVDEDASGLNQIWLQVRGGCGDPNVQIWQLHTTFCLQIEQNLAKFSKKASRSTFYLFIFFPLPNGENLPKKEPWQEVKKKG